MEKNTMKKRKLTIEEGLYLLLAGTALRPYFICKLLSGQSDAFGHDCRGDLIQISGRPERADLQRVVLFYREIRVIYTQLVMVPLFKIFSSYRLVKLLSVLFTMPSYCTPGIC